MKRSLALHSHPHTQQRRAFISTMIKASLASAFTFSLANAKAGIFSPTQKLYSVGDVMDLILKEIPGAPFDKTVDTLKSGDRDIKVTGIVTTMFATIDIIHQA